MVIISNLILFQKALGGIDDDDPFFRIDIHTDRLSEWNQNLIFIPLNDQQIVFGNRHEVFDEANFLSLHGENLTPYQLVGIIAVFIKRKQFFLRIEDLFTHKVQAQVNRINTLELYNIKRFMEPTSLNLELLKNSFCLKKDP